MSKTQSCIKPEKGKGKKKKHEIRTATCKTLLLAKAALVLSAHFSLYKIARGIMEHIFFKK